MGGKEEEEAGDVAVKMPEATLKIFNGVQVGLPHHYTAPIFCSQSNRAWIFRLHSKKKKRCVFFLLSIKLDSRSVGRFVRSFAVILSPEEREEGEAREFIISLNY